MQQEEKIKNIKIDLLIPGKYQPRKKFNEESLKELENSIKEYGILNPIIVTKNNDNFEIVAGERRYRAAKKLGMSEIPVIIKELNDSGKAEIALIENLQREGLTPIEEAKSYQEIINLGKLTQQSLGRKIGKSQSAIANKIRLLTLPKSIQDALNDKKISERHARSLMTVKDENEQIELLNKVIINKMTVKELDNLINQESITEKEIKDAINDIMKSLNISEEIEKKEEKESDNMNNGNFFPNFNNTMGPNTNVSLNTMNMQSMNSEPINIPQETVMPTSPVTMANQQIEPIMNQVQNDIYQPSSLIQEQPMPILDNSAGQFEAPLFTVQQEVQAMPTENQMMSNTMVNTLPPVQDTPLFGGDFNSQITPTIEPQMVSPEPVLEISNQNNYTNSMANTFGPQPEIQIQETAQIQEEPTAEQLPTSFEIPVITAPTVDKLTEVKTILEQNGINYKLYSNETNHCIIIEI